MHDPHVANIARAYPLRAYAATDIGHTCRSHPLMVLASHFPFDEMSRTVHEHFAASMYTFQTRVCPVGAAHLHVIPPKQYIVLAVQGSGSIFRQALRPFNYQLRNMFCCNL